MGSRTGRETGRRLGRALQPGVAGRRRILGVGGGGSTGGPGLLGYCIFCK